MKIPKRTYVTNFLEWGDEFQGRLSSGQKLAYARWKRRNKVKQLKRTIDKYKNGKKLFHDRSHLKSAYLRIQELGELEEGASIAECRGHLLLVDSIIKTLRWEQEKALRYIEIILQKEQP